MRIISESVLTLFI